MRGPEVPFLSFREDPRAEKIRNRRLAIWLTAVFASPAASLQARCVPQPALRLVSCAAAGDTRSLWSLTCPLSSDPPN